MIIALFIPLILTGGIAPEQMRMIVADRLARLDKLVIEMTWQPFVNRVERSPLDRESWIPYGHDFKYPHRIKIVRPNLLDEYLADNPEMGVVPVVESVFDGAFVLKDVRPDRFGRTVYVINEHSTSVGDFWAYPTLQVFDIEIWIGCMKQFNLLRLFDEYSPVLVAGTGEVSTYIATVPCPGWTLHLEFDLNSRGTPLHFKTVSEFITLQLEPATAEFYTLALTEVNGAELPAETVVSSYNPNINRKYRFVHHNVVTSVSTDPTLTPEDVRIVPELRNANVTTVGADGVNRKRFYDADGNVVYDVSYLASLTDTNGGLVSGQSLRWRRVVPPTAVAVGIVTLVLLRVVARPAPSLRA